MRMSLKFQPAMLGMGLAMSRRVGKYSSSFLTLCLAKFGCQPVWKRKNHDSLFFDVRKRCEDLKVTGKIPADCFGKKVWILVNFTKYGFLVHAKMFGRKVWKALTGRKASDDSAGKIFWKDKCPQKLFGRMI